MSNKKYHAFLVLFFAIITISLKAQFIPVSIGGFNHDIIAETGNSSLTTTTIAMDAVPASNNVMYTLGFAGINAFGGGGLPDNGIITDAAGSYQMASYGSGNALIVPRGQNGDLTLTTAAAFSKIRVLCLSTEGPSLVNVKLFFTDGTTTNVLNNITISDWFATTGNIVIAGFGRCNRVSPVISASTFPINPAMFYLEIPLSCRDALKTLQKINFTNVTTAGSNAPFPNAIFFAVSGKANSRNITPTITNAICAVNGSATLVIAGSAAPYNVSWNTTPLQTGLTATNLSSGNYIATITDANACISTYNVPVTLNNDLSLITTADTTICSGTSFMANTISNATNYNWGSSPGVSNPNIGGPTLSPLTTTTYTLNAILGSCSLAKAFTVTVITPMINPRLDTSLCKGGSFIPNISGNTTSYAWTPATGVSDPTMANPVLSPVNTTNYTITGTLNGCISTRAFTVAVSQAVIVDAGPPVSISAGTTTTLQGSGSTGNYCWTPASTLSTSTILNPTASPSITTQYILTITIPSGCSNYDSVLVTVIPDCIQPKNAFSPNGDGINEYWIVTGENCTSNIDAYVFNRYGDKVYESTAYHNNWNGTYKGKPLPDGTYYYILNITLNSGKKLVLKGDVTIIR